MIKLSCLSVNLPEDLLDKLKAVRPYELLFEASVESVTDATLILEKLIVQVVVLYTEKESERNLAFIELLKKIPSRPIVVVISDVVKYEGNAHLRLPTDTPIPDMASNILRMVAPKERGVEINVSRDKVLDERLANIFISAGIPPHIKGYQFLREAVKQAVNDPNMINNITKMLYPAVAERFNTSPSKVERAIRHAIEVAWSRGKIENINNVYGIKIFSKSDKPTNGELIALVSDKLLIENA